MILFHDFESCGVGDFGVLCYLDTKKPSLAMAVTSYTVGTHGFSPSSKTKSSAGFGAFMMDRRLGKFCTRKADSLTVLCLLNKLYLPTRRRAAEWPGRIFVSAEQRVGCRGGDGLTKEAQKQQREVTAIKLFSTYENENASVRSKARHQVRARFSKKSCDH